MPTNSHNYYKAFPSCDAGKKKVYIVKSDVDTYTKRDTWATDS